MVTSETKRETPKFDWFIPIDGDGHHIGTAEAERPPTFEYLKEVVQTAEKEGFYSLLIPTRFANGLFDQNSPLAETWTMVTALAAVTTKIRFLVAVRPGFISTGLFAQMAATLDQISQGRLDINIVPGGIKGDFERFGEKTDHSKRYERAEEFIAACRKLWETPAPVSFTGDSINLDGAVCSPGPHGDPSFYIGGASESALNLSARQGDTYLAWILPKEILGPHLEKTKMIHEKSGRPARFGLRTHIIVRDKEEDAWDASKELLSLTDKSVAEQRQTTFKGTPMVGQKSQSKRYEDHRVGNHLWNGISTVRVNCGTAIVGNPEQVADELLGYWKLGIDEFILSGYPHVEECSRVSDSVLPILREKINLASNS
ncbi:MAG: hypothetical protein CL782_04685 [Chloroflexi bacterium]|mgnify:FL=1|nr:hypothetical protein [Chloroflexota bacterium]|tara:strand:+ start:3486 stop:4601 length:1116 start_codon:yes stop_codon:yes gene_type:complete